MSVTPLMSCAAALSVRRAAVRPRVGPAARFITAAFALTALLAAPPAASARDRLTSITGPQGQSASRAVSREPGDLAASATGPGGRTLERRTVRGGGTVEGSASGPGGRTITRAVEREAGSASAVLTLPDGRTVVRQSEGSR